jgi:hypothetical protein
MLNPQEHRVCTGNRSVWGAADVEATEFVDNPFGHGWHVSRPTLDESLRDRLRALGIRVRSGARVAGQAWTGDHWRIGLDDHAGTTICARAIVDATGRGARIARRQGAHRCRLDRLVAAYWLLDATDTADNESTTLVEAVAHGWWYTTPVPGHRRVVAFLTDADLMPPRGARRGQDWQHRLSQAPRIRGQLARSGGRLDSSPPILDASVAHLDHASGCGWVAVGDAAVSFDPLAVPGNPHFVGHGPRRRPCSCRDPDARRSTAADPVGQGVRAATGDPPSPARRVLRPRAPLANRAVLDTTARDGQSELRQGYADVGDVRLHHVETGEGPWIAKTALPES